MSSATFVEGLHIETPRDRHPAALPSGVVVSIVFHAAVALLLVFSPWAHHETPPPEFVMEVVQLPTPPEIKKPEPPPQPQPPPQSIPLPAPEIPQLTEAPIAEKSSPPPQASKAPAPPRERPAPARAEEKAPATEAPALRAPATSKEANAVPATPNRQEHRAEPQGGASPAPASQKVQDFILMQIAQLWIIDLHSPRFRDVDIGWSFVLRPDGMLEAPFGKNDPWDLQAMVDPRTYVIMKEQTERGRFYTTVVTTFLQAVRQAQPFRVPPNEQSYVNRSLPLRFHAGDLVQTSSQSAR